MEDINCIFCGRRSDEIVIREGGFTGLRCRTCGLVYISPRPSSEDIADIYATDGAHVSARSHITTLFSRRLHAKRNLRVISSFASGGDLLELGSGSGCFLEEARRRGFSPHGIEPNPVLAEFTGRELGIPCEAQHLQESSFGGMRFDVIYHCDVLSHLFDPIGAFSAVHRALRDEGVLAFETGNVADVSDEYLHLIPSFQYPDHLFFFGLRSLSQLLAKTGFELESVHACSIVPQLVASRAFSVLRGRRRSAGPGDGRLVTTAAGDSEDSDREAASSPGSAGFIRRAGGYTRHFLRYHVGRIAPKSGRPQTVLIVARKRALS